MNKKISAHSLVLYSILCLIILTFIVYNPVLSHQFQLQWDDQWVVFNDYTESGLNKSNLLAILTDFNHGQYAPVNQLSYTLLYSAFGYNPFWFHLFGICIHISNVLLVYFLIKRILAFTGQFQTLSILRIAFITALLMGIHPFLVESVAWISASKIILYAFFYLIALHLYLSYLFTLKLKYYILVVLSFVFSFLAKEQAASLPVCLLLFDFIFKRDLSSRRIWFEKIPLFFLAILFGIITMKSQSADGVGALSSAMKYPFYQNLIFASYSITEYLVKCVVPFKLSFLYPFPNGIGQPVPARFWMYPVVLIIAVASLWNFWKQKWVLFGMLFFIIHLGLTIHIIPISRFTIIADRYVYVAAIGVFFIMAYYLNYAFLTLKYGKIITLISLIYLLSIGIYAHEHSKIWKNSNTLKKELKELLELRNKFQGVKK